MPNSRKLKEVNKLKKIKMMKKIIILLILISITIIVGACSNTSTVTVKEPQYKGKENSLNIITTNSFMETNIIKITESKHIVDRIFNENEVVEKYVYSDDTINNISKQNVFIYEGAEYEPWVDELSSKTERKNLSIINASRGADIINISKGSNPYYFMSSANYKVMMLNVKNAIEERDAKNRSFYEENFAKVINEVDKVVGMYKELSAKYNKTLVVVIGDNLDYYVKEIGLNKYKIQDVNTIQDKKTIIEIRNKISAEGKKYERTILLYTKEEELKAYDSIIKELKVLPVKITYSADDYIEIMKYNYNMLNKAF